MLKMWKRSYIVSRYTAYTIKDEYATEPRRKGAKVLVYVHWNEKHGDVNGFGNICKMQWTTHIKTGSIRYVCDARETELSPRQSSYVNGKYQPIID